VVGGASICAESPAVIAAYLLRTGYTVGTAEGWAARYGLDRLSGR
jgi:hypothetical protein